MSESPKTTDVTAGDDTITDPAEAVLMSVVGDAAKAAVDPAQARSAASAVAAAQPATTGRAGHRGTSGAAPVSRAPIPEDGAGSSELAISSGPQAFLPASAGVESGDGPAAGSVPDRVWKVLLAHPGSTPAELATAGGVGRSTVSKLLANWADAGRVTSATGVNARAARLWTATPAASTPAPQAEGESGRRARRRASGAGGRVGESTATPQAPSADPVIGRCGSPRVAVGQPGDAEPHVAVVVSTARMPGSNCAGATRLGAGELRGLVEEFLSEHPGEHGPVEIGHVLRRSSGAIANALERLVETGWAQRTRVHPKRYRFADGDESDTIDTTHDRDGSDGR